MAIAIGRLREPAGGGPGQAEQQKALDDSHSPRAAVAPRGSLHRTCPHRRPKISC
jgi:hypothetical protein